MPFGISEALILGGLGAAGSIGSSLIGAHGAGQAGKAIGAAGAVIRDFKYPGSQICAYRSASFSLVSMLRVDSPGVGFLLIHFHRGHLAHDSEPHEVGDEDIGGESAQLHGTHEG